MEIQAEIVKLQKQAADIRDKEFAATVIEIRKKLNVYGINIKDIYPTKTKGRAKKADVGLIKSATLSRKIKNAVPAKYRGPNGELWSGRGLTPKWLVALGATGRMKEEFEIKNLE